MTLNKRLFPVSMDLTPVRRPPDTELFGPWRPYRCAKGQRLFQQGSQADYLFLLESGLVKLTCTLPSGEEALLAIRFPGELVEACGPVIQMPHPFSATALTECALRQIAAPRLMSLVHSGGDAAVSLVHQLAVDLHATAVATIDLKTLTARERLERFLLRLSSVSEILGPIPIKHADLAALLGITPEHLSRLKKKFAQYGNISAPRRRTAVAA